MTRSESYQTIGYRYQPRTCAEKKLYPSRAGAVDTAETHNRRYICVGMVEYYCRRHSGWHVGHSGKRRALDREFLDAVRWFVWFASKNLRN